MERSIVFSNHNTAIWLERLVRFGCATKGLLYFTIGLLLLQITWGMGEPEADSRGAIQAIATQPYGRFLLVFIVIGLSSYALWRLVEATIAPDRPYRKPPKLTSRMGHLCSGLSYGSLAFFTLKLFLDRSTESSPNLASDWTARLLLQPFGRWLVIAIGLVIIGIGCSFCYRACSQKFRRKFHLKEIEDRQILWLMHLGRLGIVCRGLVFGAIGFFFVRAAYLFNAEEARGLDGTLKAIAEHSRGEFVLVSIAFGFMAYGLHMLIEARYRRLAWLRQLCQ